MPGAVSAVFVGTIGQKHRLFRDIMGCVEDRKDKETLFLVENIAGLKKKHHICTDFKELP